MTCEIPPNRAAVEPVHYGVWIGVAFGICVLLGIAVALSVRKYRHWKLAKDMTFSNSSQSGQLNQKLRSKN
jgi:hypothetical protein